jgi:alpha,alpha-trehalase
MQHDQGVAAKPDLQQAEQELLAALKDIDGVLIEPKGFALAVHYRLVAPEQLEQVEAVVKEVAARHPKLRRTGGKKIHEFRPDIDWNKGRAVTWVLRALDLDREDTLALYLGDDETDEDAFQVLADVGIGIRVGSPGDGTQAHYILSDTAAVKRFLPRLAAISRADGDNDGQESP